MLDQIPIWAIPLVGHDDKWKVDETMIAIESVGGRVKVYWLNGDSVEVMQSNGWRHVIRAPEVPA